MAKKVKTWEDHLKDARHYNALASQSLAKTVRLFMAEKGFCKEAVELFDMNFASGCETVITFDSEGEMCDLDITTAVGMTKEEIIEYMSRELSPYNVKRMKGEPITDDDY